MSERVIIVTEPPVSLQLCQRVTGVIIVIVIATMLEIDLVGSEGYMQNLKIVIFRPTRTMYTTCGNRWRYCTFLRSVQSSLREGVVASSVPVPSVAAAASRATPVPRSRRNFGMHHNCGASSLSLLRIQVSIEVSKTYLHFFTKVDLSHSYLSSPSTDWVLAGILELQRQSSRPVWLCRQPLRRSCPCAR